MRVLRALASLAVIAVIALFVLGVYLYVEITSTFESRLWKDPATIWSASLVARPGDVLDRDAVLRRLERSGYGKVDHDPSRPGQYRSDGIAVDVFLREYRGPGAGIGPRRHSLRFVEGRLASVRDAAGREVDAARFEPELLATLYGESHEERSVLPYAAFPEPFIRGVLAAEDARYFEHGGVDVRAVLRAALANLRSGKVVQGGSTITQQTVKNLYLTHRRTLWRKLRELPMAVVLDLRYPKERILEVYLNEVYLGQRGAVAICGAEAAAQFYFGRSLSHLSLGEWAVLAGMIRSPGRYNPFVHPDRATARRDQVIDAMVRKGWLGDAAAAGARSESLQLGSGSSGFGRAGYAVDLVRRDLDRYYGRRALQDEGLRVYTTFDTLVQERAADSLDRGLSRLESDHDVPRKQVATRSLQGAVVVLRPESGEVLALVGGRDYATTQFNRAVQARRQPGSCFKPFVFAAGFERAHDALGRGLTPATLLDDSPMAWTVGGKDWTPRNYDREFRGPISVRRTLVESLNVPTVRAARHVGLDQVIATAHRCGIESDLVDYPSLALGAQEVTPLELAMAYASFANGGFRVTPRTVLEVRDAAGERLERGDVRRSYAVRPQTAFLVNDVLQDVLVAGTGKSARRYGYHGDAAGKTGTTDDTRDAWFVGYTPDILGLVWVGYDDNARTGLTGASGALPIWADLMRATPAADGQGSFPEVSGVVPVEIDPTTAATASKHCPETRLEWFAIGTEPAHRCLEHAKGPKKWFRKLFGKKRTEDEPI